MTIHTGVAHGDENNFSLLERPEFLHDLKQAVLANMQVAKEYGFVEAFTWERAVEMVQALALTCVEAFQVMVEEDGLPDRQYKALLLARISDLFELGL